MIKVYALTYKNQTEVVQAIPEPKHVWVDGDKIIVYTGNDIPPKPAQGFA